MAFKGSHTYDKAKYKDAKSLQKAIDMYFNKCNIDNIKPTLCGMAYDLGFSDRNSIDDYAKLADDRSGVIKRARLKLQSYLAELLINGKIPVAGVIFSLRQYGWTEDQHIIHSTGNLDSLERLRNTSVKQIEKF